MTWRWLGWGSVLGCLVLGLVGVVAFLAPPAARGGGDATVTAHVRLRDGSLTTAVLAREPDGWVGRAADFPIGAVAHVQPRGASPGFFLVRADSGMFRGYADRSPHRGEPLQLRQPLAPGHVEGVQLGLYDPSAGAQYTLDGEPFLGPGPRPLDPFPLRLDGERLVIRTHALCPDSSAQAWCGAGEDGPRVLDRGRAVVLLVRASIAVFSEPGLRAGDTPTRRLTAQELRAYGFEVAHSVDELHLAVSAGARVVWIDAAALARVPTDWARRWYDLGVAIGVLDGTLADLAERFGIGANNASWIQPGTGRPVFALARSGGQASDWLNVAALLAHSG